jgi:hypothetical protein
MGHFSVHINLAFFTLIFHRYELSFIVFKMFKHTRSTRLLVFFIIRKHIAILPCQAIATFIINLQEFKLLFISSFPLFLLKFQSISAVLCISISVRIDRVLFLGISV